MNFMNLQTFSSTIPYWHALEKTCPKQLPLKLSSNLRISQLTTNFSAKVIAFKLAPSSLTNVMIFYLWPKESKRLLKFITKICPIVLVASNNPIVTCWGWCQFASIKLITNAKISWVLLNIHKSKLTTID
jgi:hypothetical protein